MLTACTQQARGLDISRLWFLTAWVAGAHSGCGDEMDKKAWVATLDSVAAISALAAAFFWFGSAWGELPPMKMYWGGAPPDDAFFVAVKKSAQMNWIAALFSGVSALFIGIASLIRR
jgi:hypothetical protein